MLRGFLLVTLSGCQVLFPLPSTPADAPTDASVTAGPCPTKAAALVEPFRTAGPLAPAWDLFRTSLTNENLTATMTAAGVVLSTGGPGGVAVASHVAYDLTDVRVAVDLSAPLPPGEMTTTTVRFGIVDPASFNEDSPGIAPSVEWTLDSTTGAAMLVPTKQDDGNNFVPLRQAIPYDPATHRFLAMSRVGDRIQWEVSANGTQFDVIHDAAMPGRRMVRPYLGNSHGADTTPDYPAIFADLNVHEMQLGVCPVAGLVDTFDVDDPVTWFRHTTINCQIDVTGGEVKMSSTVPSSFDCRHATTGVYDLTNGTVDVETGTIALGDAREGYAKLELADRTELRIGVAEILTVRTLIVAIRKPGDTADTPLYKKPEGATDRHWRFSATVEPAGTHRIAMSTSSDGAVFTPRAEYGGVTGLERTRLILGADGGATTVVRFNRVGGL